MVTSVETKSEVIAAFPNEKYFLLLNKKVSEFGGAYKLTKREIELLTLSIIGNSNKKIAVDCYISEKTVKHHFENIKAKIAVQSSRQLMALFVESLSESWGNKL